MVTASLASLGTHMRSFVSVWWESDVGVVAPFSDVMEAMASLIDVWRGSGGASVQRD